MTAHAHANGRAINVCLPGESLVCPHGHNLPRDFWTIGEEPGGGQRCKLIEPPARGERRGSGVECGMLVYWMLFPGGIRLVAEVTSRELHEMERAHMSIAQIRDFLGLRWMPRRAA